MSFLVLFIHVGNFTTLATCSLRYTHKKVDVLIGGIFGIDIFHLNSVVIVKS